MTEFKQGDKVRVITESEEFEGILMPRPEILEGDFTIVKLDSGYNVGIETKKIERIELIEKYKPKETKKKPIKPKD